MSHLRKSVIVPHSCDTMFALVDAVEAYPEFLPWCAGAEVLERDETLTRARLHVDYHGLRTRFGTRNAKRAPHEMRLALDEGPFDRLAGTWRFTPLGESGCRVELELDYELASATARALLAPVFAHIAQTMVERFVQRADSVAGGST